MVEIGKFNKLRVKDKATYGYNLDGGDLGDILLLNKQAKAELSAGDLVDVFVYMDSDDKLLATMNTPKAMVGEFSYLKCVAVNRAGAFLDMGLAKDVLVRLSEQRIPMKEGHSYVVYVFREEENMRLAASSKLDHYFNPDIANYEEGQQVDILVWEQTELGYKAIINNADLGLLYNTEIFHTLNVGQKTQAYIKKVREDLKIDLVLQKPGYEKPDALSEKIIKKLEASNGFLNVNDKSDAREISRLFGVSKKKFKMAIGGLYKKRTITISDDGIRLIEK